MKVPYKNEFFKVAYSNALYYSIVWYYHNNMSKTPGKIKTMVNEYGLDTIMVHGSVSES